MNDTATKNQATADYHRQEELFWLGEADTAETDSYRMETLELARQARERANHHDRAAAVSA